jgi:hypothetical protein
MNDFPTWLQALEQWQRPYALIGGMALAFWGVIRSTSDIDFLVDATSSAMKHQAEVWAQQGWHVQYRPSVFGDPLGDVMNIVHDFQAQLIQAIHDHELSALHRVHHVSWFNTRVPVVDVNDLVLMKGYAGGPQDWLDIERLLQQAPRSAWDRDYLQHQLTRLPDLRSVTPRLHPLLQQYLFRL